METLVSLEELGRGMCEAEEHTGVGAGDKA
jgi:hypothetical protein